VSKEKERLILHMVYDEAELASVDDQERPDFAIRRHDGSTRFGVEVTELYDTNSDARAAHHPSYITELLGGGEHMHRDDVRGLPLCTTTVTDPDGNVKATNVPCIIRELPPLIDTFRRLSKAIQRKDRSRDDDYGRGLTHVNLVVLDGTARPLTLSDEYRTRDVLIPELQRTLVETNFREVFFVTKIGQNRRVVIPRRMLFLLSSWYTFLGALDSCEDSTTVLEEQQIPPLFVAFMQRSGVDVRLVSTVEPDARAALFGSSDLTFSPEKGLTIRDHGDTPLPATLPADVSLLRLLGDGFETHYRAFSGDATVVTALAYNAKIKRSESQRPVADTNPKPDAATRNNARPVDAEEGST